MSDAKISIPIDIPPGDVSGPELAIQQIEEIKETAEQANVDVGRSAESIEDVFSKTAEGAKKADEGFKKLFDQQRLQGIGQQLGVLAQSAGAFAREFSKSDAGKEMFSGLSEEATIFGETALSIANGVAQGYAQGGPIGAAIGGLAGLIDKVGGEWLDSNARIVQAEKEVSAAILANTSRIRERRKEAAGREIEQTYRSEKQELEAQRQELERIAKIRNSERDLAKAKDKLADAKAVAAGTPQAAVDIENVGQDFEAQRQALGDELAGARAELQTLGAELFAATDAYNAQARLTGTKSEEAVKALELVNNLAKDTTNAEGNVAALEVELNNQAQSFAADAETKLVQQGERLLGSLESSASNLEDSLKAGIDAAGNNASTAARVALVDVQRVLEDGVVKPEEVNVLLQAAQQLRASTEAKDNKTAEAIKQITENGKLYNENLTGAISNIRRQGEMLEQQKRDLQELHIRLQTIGG